MSGNVAYAGPSLTSLVNGGPLDCSGGCTIVVQASDGLCAPVTGPWGAQNFPTVDCSAVRPASGGGTGVSWSSAVPSGSPDNPSADAASSFTCIVISNTALDVADAPFTACQASYPPAYWGVPAAPVSSMLWAPVAGSISTLDALAPAVGVVMVGVLAVVLGMLGIRRLVEIVRRFLASS